MHQRCTFHLIGESLNFISYLQSYLASKMVRKLNNRKNKKGKKYVQSQR